MIFQSAFHIKGKAGLEMQLIGHNQTILLSSLIVITFKTISLVVLAMTQCMYANSNKELFISRRKLQITIHVQNQI